MEHWHRGTFRKVFIQLMTDKNIDSKSESIPLQRARAFKAAETTKLQCKLRINRALLFTGVDANIVIVTVIVLGVNGSLHRLFLYPL